MKRIIREYVLENWGLKATALFLGLILWLFVRGEPGPARVVAVPLEVQMPGQMEITNERPTTVEITMRGAAFSNILFSSPLPTCIVNLQGAGEGEHSVILTPENIKIPKGSGIEVLQVNPTHVTVVLEKTIQKEVPIVPPIEGEPAPGFEIYSKSSTPSQVVIKGPRTHIESVKAIATEAVSIADQNQPAHFYVRLNPSDPMIQTNFANPVEVEIQVGPRRRLHTFRQVTVSTDDDSYTAFPKQISVQVLAPPEMVKTVTPAEITATVETKGLDPSTLPAKVRPLIQLPNSLKDIAIVREVQPPVVTVRKAQEK